MGSVADTVASKQTTSAQRSANAGRSDRADDRPPKRTTAAKPGPPNRGSTRRASHSTGRRSPVRRSRPRRGGTAADLVGIVALGVYAGAAGNWSSALASLSPAWSGVWTWSCRPAGGGRRPGDRSASGRRRPDGESGDTASGRGAVDPHERPRGPDPPPSASVSPSSPCSGSSTWPPGPGSPSRPTGSTPSPRPAGCSELRSPACSRPSSGAGELSRSWWSSPFCRPA